MISPPNVAARAAARQHNAFWSRCCDLPYDLPGVEQGEADTFEDRPFQVFAAMRWIESEECALRIGVEVRCPLTSEIWQGRGVHSPRR
ncbi:MAG: hypothetical protein R2843_04655 [Thermomicrobiales bacterium]